MNKLYYTSIILVCFILLISTIYQVFEPAQTCLYNSTSPVTQKLYGSILGPFNAYTETTLPYSVSYSYNLFFTILIISLFFPISYLIKRPRINLFVIGMYITQLIIAPFYFNTTKCFQGGTSLFSVDIIFTTIFTLIVIGIYSLGSYNFINLREKIYKKVVIYTIYIAICCVYFWGLTHYPYQEHIFGLEEWLILLFALIIIDFVMVRIKKPILNFFKKE